MPFVISHYRAELLSDGARREALLAVGGSAFPVAAALTLQGPRGALDFRPVSPAFLVAQIDALLNGRGPRPQAVKTGMLGMLGTARALAKALERPALAPLLARATVVTPNWPELEALVGATLRGDDEAVEAARQLGSRAVLVTGGHRRGPPIDLLVEPRSVRRFEGRRRPGTARGTGCRLASALAGLLAQGAALDEAVCGAKRIVEAYLDDPFVIRGFLLRGREPRRGVAEPTAGVTYCSARGPAPAVTIDGTSFVVSSE